MTDTVESTAERPQGPLWLLIASAALAIVLLAVAYVQWRQYQLLDSATHYQNDALGWSFSQLETEQLRLRNQVQAGLAGLTPAQVQQAVIAYEPVWAIGTGKTATPDDAQEVCGAIRVRLAEKYGAETADAVRIQYGGSVKASNIAAIMAQPDVDGALIGGASLDAEEFASIVRFREHVQR